MPDFARSLAQMAVCALALLPSAARADVLWKGDFETGDLKQWSYLLNEGGLSVVDSPVAEGLHSARVQITKNDLWSNGLNRVELQYAPVNHNTAGSEIYFGYSLYVPELLTTDSHQLGYWETGSTYQQLFHVAAMGSRVALRTQKPNYKEQWALDGLLTPGVWHRLVWHIVWSADPAVGTIDLWWDGVQRVTALKVQTYLDNPPFVQVGILRDTIDAVELLYLDDARAGTSYDDVKGSAPAGGAGTGGVAGGGQANSAGDSAGGAHSGAGAGGAGVGGAGSAGGAGAGGSSGAGPDGSTLGGSASNGGASSGAPSNSNAGGGGAASAPTQDSSCSVASVGAAQPAAFWAIALAGLVCGGRRARRLARGAQRVAEPRRSLPTQLGLVSGKAFVMHPDRRTK